MFAIVDNGVSGEVVAQPEISGQVMMRRHERRIMVSGFGVNAISTRRLNADGDVAVKIYSKVEGISVKMRIGLWFTPPRYDLCTDGLGEKSEVLLIVT